MSELALSHGITGLVKSLHGKTSIPVVRHGLRNVKKNVLTLSDDASQPQIACMLSLGSLRRLIQVPLNHLRIRQRETAQNRTGTAPESLFHACGAPRTPHHPLYSGRLAIGTGAQQKFCWLSAPNGAIFLIFWLEGDPPRLCDRPGPTPLSALYAWRRDHPPWSRCLRAKWPTDVHAVSLQSDASINRVTAGIAVTRQPCETHNFDNDFNNGVA